MILAIDIGNTNIVIGCMEDDRILLEARIATDSLKTADQYCIELHNLLSLYGIDLRQVEGSIISSVVPPVLTAVQTAVCTLTGKDCLIVGPGVKTGLNIRMDNPSEVGSDLIVAAVAASAEYGTPLLLVDMGTATTITAVDRSGSFIGGCICPGVRISLEALAGRTAQLMSVRLDAPENAIGKNTAESMRSGIVLGSAAMLDGMLDRMEAELGEKATVIATGGMSEAVIPLCRRKLIYDKSLLLKGLNLIYKRNQKPKKEAP